MSEDVTDLQIDPRRWQREALARAAAARISGRYIAADDVIRRLQCMLDEAKLRRVNSNKKCR